MILQNALPYLSVVVPIYGVEDYLEECIDSILSQTYQNLEILLIDDGAKGREPQICDSYAEKDSRIQVIHKKNGGLVAARKTGLENATSEFVTFVDGDDFIAPDYYEKMMKWVITEAPDLVVAAFTRVRHHQQIIEPQKMEDGIYEGTSLQTVFENMNCYGSQFFVPGIWAPTCFKVYRTRVLRELTQDIPNNIRLGEDAAVSYPYILKCKKIVIDNSIHGYHYRYLENSMSKLADASLFTASSALYEYLAPRYRENGTPGVMRQLGLYRAYLMRIALERWMRSVPWKDIHKTVLQIAENVNKSTLFRNIDQELQLDIPDYLKELFLPVSQQNWKKFEIIWKKKIISSYIPATIKEPLKKALNAFVSNK